MEIFQTPYPQTLPPQPPQPTSPPKHSRKKLIIALGIVIVVVLALILVIFSSAIFGKPTKPNIINSAINHLFPLGGGDSKILESDINYLANEIGAYSLHTNLLNGEKPEIEVVVSDTGQYFDVTVERNVPYTSERKADSPDLRIVVDKDTLVNILTSKSMNKDVLDYYKEGKVVVVVLKSFDVLFLKGYKEIYNSLNQVPVTAGILVSIGKIFPTSQQGFYL